MRAASTDSVEKMYWQMDLMTGTREGPLILVVESFLTQYSHLKSTTYAKGKPTRALVRKRTTDTGV